MKGTWLVLALFTAACASGSERSGAGGAAASTIGHGGNDSLLQIVSVAIEPADAVIVVENGAIPTPTPYSAVATRTDGSTVTLTGTWSFDRPDLGTLADTGAFTASGLLGGKGQVSFEGEGFEAHTSLTIKLLITSNPEGVASATQELFDKATQPDAALDIRYPYDATVLPRGIAGPTLQWNGGLAQDLYRVRLESEFVEFVGYKTVPPKSRYDFPTTPVDAWLKLTDSTEGDVTASVQRLSNGTAYLPKTQTWKIAPANLTGLVYFWETTPWNVFPQASTIVRLEPGEGSPQPFLQMPPGVTCVACHSVSKDGSTIVASFDGSTTGLNNPWGVYDAQSGALVYDSSEPSGFQAVSPTGSHVLYGTWRQATWGRPSDGKLNLSTSTDKTSLALLDFSGIGYPGYPTWSTDGKKVAVVVRTDSQEDGLHLQHSSLWIADVDLLNPGFSNLKKIASPTTQATVVTYPSFSPDSQWIAVSRATHAQSTSPMAWGAQGELWLTSIDGTAHIALDNLNGKAYLTPSQSRISFVPNFLPVSVGGYFWVVFQSPRIYGNTLEDEDPTTRRTQLWVAAIDADPKPGQDPSHPAFWLPGQDVAMSNMRGQWSLSPCKPKGSSCEAGYECCDGFCKPDGMGGFVCEDDDGGCSAIGDACQTAADCCDPGAQCIGGYCDLPPSE